MAHYTSVQRKDIVVPSCHALRFLGFFFINFNTKFFAFFSLFTFCLFIHHFLPIFFYHLFFYVALPLFRSFFHFFLFFSPHPKIFLSISIFTFFFPSSFASPFDDDRLHVYTYICICTLHVFFPSAL